MVIFPIKKIGRVEKSQKKKKKKKVFYGTLSLSVFLFPVIKRGKKVSGFVFFRTGRVKKGK